MSLFTYISSFSGGGGVSASIFVDIVTYNMFRKEAPKLGA